MKSPLVYCGAKSLGLPSITGFIPAGTRTLVAPFMGGGSVELWAAGKGIRVHGYDDFMFLVEFWKCVLKDAPRVATEAAKIWPLRDADQFRAVRRRTFKITDVWQRAGHFFAVQRTGWGGLGYAKSCGITVDPALKFNEACISYLRKFRAPTLTVECRDFAASMDAHRHDFMYADPPYYGKANLYGPGNRGPWDFDHRKLRMLLGHRRGNWLLSYNDCPEVRRMYKGFKILAPKWRYGLRQSESNELLILGPEIAAGKPCIDDYFCEALN